MITDPLEQSFGPMDQTQNATMILEDSSFEKSKREKLKKRRSIEQFIDDQTWFLHTKSKKLLKSLKEREEKEDATIKALKSKKKPIEELKHLEVLYAKGLNK